jgi:hypothetical protein
MKNIYKILVGKHEETKDLGVAGRIILEWILRCIEWEVVDWIHLVQNMGYWRALVNTVMNLSVP